MNNPYDHQISVAAVVVTAGAEQILGRCLDSLKGQLLGSHFQLSIYVVDSTPSNEPRMKYQGIDGVYFRREGKNVGPAGGFQIGIHDASASVPDFYWLLDDDLAPRPDCLAELFKALMHKPDLAVSFPTVVDPSQTIVEEHGWLGALVPAEVIDLAGLPDGRLFNGYEDTEWFHFRLRDRYDVSLLRSISATAELLVVGNHSYSNWKLFYKARNGVFTNLYCRPSMAFYRRLNAAKSVLLRWLKIAATQQGRHGWPSGVLLVLLGAALGSLGVIKNFWTPGRGHLDRPTFV